jgi:hypothetical protein
MKKLLLIFSIIFSNVILCQSNGITYQAVIYDPGNDELPWENNNYSPLIEHDICLRFNFIDSNNALEYQEIIQVTTDLFGMINLIIGNESQTGGYSNGFNNILWDGSPKNIKIEIDINNNCNEFIQYSNEPLTYVPFSYFSLNSGTTGEQGPPGPQGEQGDIGQTGEQGPPGPQGEQGDIGQTGEQGQPGPQGEQGDIGQTGEQGPTGPQGEQGDDGLSAYEIWINLGNIGNEQDFINSLTGPSGEQGPQGPEGSSSNNLNSNSSLATVGDYNWDIPGWKYNQLNGDIKTYIRNDTYVCFPIKVDRATNYTEIGLFRDYSGDDGMDNVMIAVLSSNNGFPGELVENLGVMNVPDQNSGYQFHSKSINFTLEPGYYFVAVSISENSIGNSDGNYTKLVNAVNYVSGTAHFDSPMGQITKINGNGLSISIGSAYKFIKPINELNYSSISISNFIDMIDEPGSIIWFRAED